MRSIEFLEAAIAIQAERGAEYNKAQGERSAQAVATAFNAITGKDLTESEVWLLLQVLKDVRQWADPTRYHHDSAVDGVSYSALKAESLYASQPIVCTEPARPPLPEHWRPGDAVRFTGETRMNFENGGLYRVVESTNLGGVSVKGLSGFVGCWPFGAAATEWSWEARP